MFRGIRAHTCIPLASDIRYHPGNLANTRRNCRPHVNGVKGGGCRSDTLLFHHGATFHGYLGLSMRSRYPLPSRREIPWVRRSRYFGMGILSSGRGTYRGIAELVFHDVVYDTCILRGDVI